MRTIGIILATAALTGCSAFDDAALHKCEIVIKAQLKSPSSYKRVSATKKVDEYVIEYDAVNSFNAPLRGSGTCHNFPDGSALWIEDTPRK